MTIEQQQMNDDDVEYIDLDNDIFNDGEDEPVVEEGIDNEL